MSYDQKLLHWINVEIPNWLDQFSSFEEFSKATASAAASGLWKTYAFAMAKEKWQVKITRIPR